MLEAQLVYLAGVSLKSPYLRWLGTGLFAVQTGRLLLVDMYSLPDWTSVAAVDAVLFYVNRALEADDLFFGYAAAAMLALVTGYEASERYRSLGWLVLAAGTFTFGWWRRLFDFRLQGYLLGILGVAAVWAEVGTNLPALWGALAFSYALALCARYLPDSESQIVRHIAAWSATLAAAALGWRIVPADYLGLYWMALALALLELGLRNLPAEFRLDSYLVALLGAFRVWESNLFPIVKSRPLIPAAATVLAYALAGRAWSIKQRKVYAVALAAGTAFLLNALWNVLPESGSAPLWALVSLGLMLAGFEWEDPVMRWYGYVVAALAFLRCWGINFLDHAQPVLAGPLAAACFFAAQLRTPRGHPARVYCALLGASLITLLLWYQSSGSLLTVAWGIEGVTLLVAGFPLRDRVLRLSGLALLMSCILKLFLWDLRHLDTLPRIFSFIVLGLILVGVSWIYTRFREHVERYL